ncbi:hypothetical protein MVEN_01818500 [Mycena venus]|uniref:DUF6534 domain-containing protein n=1 Tax=Mycena venus TaxID=2733690 RepID=A0A8H6XKS5_9AGAR|nr:hypothetical protein MVEN_01818500 [Mycena venus]
MAVYSTQPQTLDNTLGAVFLGVAVSCILFGVSSLQAYHYYHYYVNDSRLHKIAVGLLWVLDATHLSLTIASSYHYAINGFGRVAVLDLIIWPIKLQIAINVVIILLVQSLYAYRVWLLGGYHHGVLGYIVAGVVLGGFGIGIVLSYETCDPFITVSFSPANDQIPCRYTVNHWSETGRIAWAVEASFAASTTIDIIISVAMCYYLRKSKGKESRLNSRISTLMQYTVSCGIFTSACSVSCLFTFLLMPNNLVFLALSYLLTRLYVNSFMAMMNARERVRRHDDSTFMPSNHHISSAAFTFTNSQHSDKYDWVDVPVPVPSLPSLSSGTTYVPALAAGAYDTQKQTRGYTYARQW